MVGRQRKFIYKHSHPRYLILVHIYYYYYLEAFCSVRQSRTKIKSQYRRVPRKKIFYFSIIYIRVPRHHVFIASKKKVKKRNQLLSAPIDLSILLLNMNITSNSSVGNRAIRCESTGEEQGVKSPTAAWGG